MGYIRGLDRNQIMLLPESLDDYVSPENPVRVVDAFVDGIDLAEVGIDAKAEWTAGRDGYDPRVLLKLYIYGYLNRVRSSRALERETGRNVEVIWLTGKQQPDHWTINNFRGKHCKAFKAVLREFNLLCLKLDLFGRELAAIDGSFFKAVNSKAGNFTKAKLKALIKGIDEHVAEYLTQLESADGKEAAAEETTGLAEKLEKLGEKRRECQGLLAQAEDSPSGQVSLNDPDSRHLTKPGQSVVGHNVQVAVDSKYHLIAAADVTGDGNDSGQLAPMARAAGELLGADRLEVVADAGYDTWEQIAACEGDGIEVHVPERAKKDAGQGAHPASSFHHDAATDSYTCPQGEQLTRHKDTDHRGIKYAVYYNTAACRACPVREACTKGKYRKLKIHPQSAVRKEVSERMAQHPEIYARRQGLVEHVFGTIKYWDNQGSFLCCGREKVTGEFMLSCLSYNLRRALKVVGVPAMLEALRRSAG